MRCSSNGQRYIHSLTVGIRRTGIGRDVLVVDVGSTLDVPVVSGHTARSLIAVHIPITYIIAVVDDGLRAMYEVTRTLPLRLVVLIDSIVGII